MLRVLPLDICKYIWTHFLDDVDRHMVRVALRVRYKPMDQKRVLIHCFRHDYQTLFWHYYDATPRFETVMLRESLFLKKDLTWFWDRMKNKHTIDTQHVYYAHTLYYSAWLIRNGVNVRAIQDLIADEFKFLSDDDQKLAMELGIFNGYGKAIVMRIN